MFILRDIAHPLQAQFSDTKLGQKRASLFVYTLLSIIIPFTSSITSNCLRCLGSQSSQCRNAQAVMNHLNFCMMASTLTWIYADRLKADPERRHKVKGRTSFAFSDVRRIIAEAALHDDFDSFCPKPGNSPKNSLAAVLLRMVA